jgi:ABC-type transporter MlaC component
MIKRTYYIHCADNGKRVLETVSGYIDGEFGYHQKDGGSWTVTDMATGGVVIKGNSSLKRAKEAMANPDLQEQIAKTRKTDEYAKFLDEFKRLIAGQYKGGLL